MIHAAPVRQGPGWRPRKDALLDFIVTACNAAESRAHDAKMGRILRETMQTQLRRNNEFHPTLNPLGGVAI